MKGTIHIWWHAPGEGKRKWAISLKGDRKEREVVDEVIFRKVYARTTIAASGKGVVEVEDAMVDLLIREGERIAYVSPDDGEEVVYAQDG